MPVPVTLKVFKGDELIASKDYEREIIKIGRLSSAHLCLNDDRVSRIHSVIEVGADGALSIIDMGSLEGTWVNGKRVNKGALSFGDEIRVGNTTLRIEDTRANLQAAAQAVAPEESHEEPAPQEEPAAPAAIAAPPEPEPSSEPEPPRTHAQLSLVRGAPEAEPEAAQEREMPPPPVMEEPQLTPPPAYSAADEEAFAPRYGHRATRKKGAGPLGLELRFLWGDQMVGEFFLPPGTKAPFTVGSARGVSFEMGDSKLGGPSFELVKPEGQTFVVRFTGKMKGEYWEKGEAMDLVQAIETRRANRDGDAYALSLGSDDYIAVDLGGVRLEACLQPVPKPVLVPLGETIDYALLNILLVLFFVSSVFVVTAHTLLAESDLYSDELNSSQARIAKLILKPQQQQKNPFLERLEKQKQAGEAAAKHRGEEGQMGKRDAPKRNARTAPKGDPNNKDQARMLTEKIFGGKGGGLSTVFGANGLGGELKSAMGNMFGAAPGDAAGFGGLGLRGSGAGGGGVGNTIGIGAVGTKGRGGGVGSYGSGVGLGMGGKKGVDIGIAASDPEVTGSLDKELIRQVIRRNIGQIRYCYESQLTRYPKLNGKVTVKFVITAMGSVSTSNVSQSTAHNAELETCVAGRVRTWQFPKPKGGGVVIVSYPFVFKQSGE